jgi:hypothetical protein
MKGFNYSLATQEQVNDHVLRMSSQAISKMLAYHLNLGHLDIAEKITKARHLAKTNKAIAALEKYLETVGQNKDKQGH